MKPKKLRSLASTLTLLTPLELRALLVAVEGHLEAMEDDVSEYEEARKRGEALDRIGVECLEDEETLEHFRETLVSFEST